MLFRDQFLAAIVVSSMVAAGVPAAAQAPMNDDIVRMVKDKPLPSGVVTATRGKYCEVSLGTADGVAVGQVFELRAGDKFTRRTGIVRRVDPDRAIVECLFIESLPAKVGTKVVLLPQLPDLEAVATSKPQSPVRGVVMMGQKEFGKISIGSDDGLAVGQTLDVKRGRICIGSVIVRKVASDHAIVESTRERAMQMEAGDDVVSR